MVPDSRFVLERVAISDRAETRWLYYIPQQEIDGRWLAPGFQGVASLSREHVAKNLNAVGVGPDCIEAVAVDCDTLDAVLARNRVTGLDVLCVDAEGYDYEVLRQLDFKKLRPRLILYEHYNLGRNLGEARMLLKQNGYRIVNCGTLDSLAVL
jgi:FkbM family methyltransferase